MLLQGGVEQWTLCCHCECSCCLEAAVTLWHSQLDAEQQRPGDAAAPASRYV